MKRFLFFALILIFANSTFAQENESEEVEPRIYLGLNYGIGYLGSDVRDCPGLGTGVLLEGHLIKNDHSLLGLSVRGRWLYERMKGQDLFASSNIQNNNTLDDYYPSPGYVFHNYKTNLHEGGAELAIYANKLRANTGMLLYGFGGLNIASYVTRINKYNTLGQLYDYGSIGTGGDKQFNRIDLNQMLDRTYETSQPAQLVFSPSLGFGIGLEAGKRLYLTWEHKVNFTVRDDLDGNRWATNTDLSSNNDRYYYTSFNFNIGLGGGSGNISTNVTTTNETNVITNNHSNIKSPVIKLISPTFIQSDNCLITAEAYVHNIESVTQVTITKNGAPIPTSEYSYNSISNILTIQTNVHSHETLKIIAQNVKGKATQKIYLECTTKYIDPDITENPVKVDIINPATDFVRVEDQNFLLKAEILNADQQNIKLEVNGAQVPFNFSGNILSKSLVLRKGINHVLVKASNNSGSDKDQVKIDLIEPLVQSFPPSVNITSPSTSPYEESDNLIDIVAELENLKLGEFTVEFDRQPITNYSYNNGVLKTTVRVDKDATFSISGTNSYGEANDFLFLRKSTAQIITDPSITFINPADDRYTSPTKEFEVKAKITKALVHDIGVQVDGKTVFNWKFFNQILTLPLSLNSSNNISITVSGNSGSARDARTIFYNAGIPLPTVDIYDPAKSPYETIVSKTWVRARVTNADKENIHVFVNGMEQFDWEWFDGQNIVVKPIRVNGTKEVKIAATNNSGTVSDKVIIKSKESLLAPNILLVSPIKNTYSSTNCNVKIDAIVRNAKKEDITVLVNNTPYYAFQYVNNHITMNVNYESGWKVVIKAKNSSGQDEETIQLLCKEETIKAPTVKFIKPTSNRYTSPTCATEFKAVVTNAQRQDISVQVNGKPYVNWLLNANTVSFKLSHQGETEVEISVSNQGGRDSDSRLVYCNPPQKNPDVKIITPGPSVFSSSDCRVSLKARVSNAEAEEIKVTINGAKVDFRFDGTYVTADLKYKNGSILKVTATTQFGRSEDQVNLKCTPVVIPNKPVVTITNPSSSSYTTTNCNFSLKATVTYAERNQVTVKVNNMIVNNWTWSNGFITLPVKIKGRANVTVSAKNTSATASDETALYCNAAMPAPIVQLVNPSRTTYETQNCAADIKIKVLHTKAENIKVTLGGAPYSMEFDGTFLTGNVRYKNNQRLRVVATNDIGRDEKSILLKCNPTPTKPKVTIVSPSSSVYRSTKCNTTVKARVEHAKHSEITVLVNNRTITNWTLSAGMVSVPVKFNGSSNITITAKNLGGRSSDSRTLICEPVATPPVIKLITPNTSTYRTDACNLSFKANVRYATKSQIQLKLNGVSKPFSMSGTIITAKLNFNNGDRLEIVAQNNDGRDSKTINLYCTPIRMPNVKIQSPASNPWTSSNCSANLIAKVTNVTKNQIKVTLNGRAIAFSYSGQLVKAQFNYTHGSTLKITATNAAGSASDGRILNCRPPVKAPTIQLINPNSSTYTSTECRVNFKALVKNVSKSEITLKHNGRLIPFSFSNGTVAATINFKNGDQLILTAKNSAGTASKSVKLNCTPVKKPTVTFISPARSPFLATNCKVNVVAKVTDIKSKAGLQITVDGKPISNYSFSNGKITFTANSGASTVIKIIARNSKGISTKSVTVQCKSSNGGTK